MEIIREDSRKEQGIHVTLTGYKNLNNVPHYHNDCEMVFVRSGQASVTVDGSEFPLGTGECAFLHGGDVHCIQSGATSILLVLKVDGDYFGPILSSGRLAGPLLKADHSVCRVFDVIAKELRCTDGYGSLAADCEVTRLLISVFRKEETVSAPSPGRQLHAGRFYDDISRLISEQYATITFDEAAGLMHFSRPYFSKTFRRVFGMTFTHYLNTVRVAVAVEQILDGGRSVTEICFGCGFNTIRNFNRVFKSFTGYSPKNLPENYVFIRNFRDGSGLDPTLNCTEILNGF